MASLYPSLEDMNVDQMARSQLEAATVAHAVADAQARAIASGYTPMSMSQSSSTSLYAGLGLEELLGSDYLGLDLSEQTMLVRLSGADPAAAAVAQQLATIQPGTVSTLPGSQAIASITPKQDAGMCRAEIKQGVREVILAKDGQGKLGFAVKAIDKGVFIAFIYSGSAAAMGGLRFGDQILQINGESVAGWDEKKTIKVLQAADARRVSLAVRDRPWCRTLTVIKDSFNHIGFMFRNGEITAIVKDSSAARNGLLINHRLVEINGQNVVGLKDAAIQDTIQAAPRSVTLTIMPTFVYDHLIKKIGYSMIKKCMDHSIPEY